jgi:cytoskeletal protein RodZ
VNEEEAQVKRNKKEVWNPWKAATLGIAVVVTTALITGLVVAYWNDNDKPTQTAKPAAAVSRGTARPVAATVTPRPVAATPQGGQPSSTTATNPTAEILKDAIIGGAIGAGVGAAGGAIAGGGKGAGKGAAIGGIVGATAGTLYGINQTNRR